VRNKLTVVCLMAVGFLAVSASLFAHHGNAAYDYAKTVTVKGTVTEWVFANPHSFLKLDVTDDKGNMQHWILEGSAAQTTNGQGGWHKTVLKPGDVITVDLMPTKNGATIGRIRRIVLADGKVLEGFGSRYTL
jgi:hypothetical protein